MSRPFNLTDEEIIALIEERYRNGESISPPAVREAARCGMTRACQALRKFKEARGEKSGLGRLDFHAELQLISERLGQCAEKAWDEEVKLISAGHAAVVDSHAKEIHSLQEHIASRDVKLQEKDEVIAQRDHMIENLRNDLSVAGDRFAHADQQGATWRRELEATKEKLVRAQQQLLEEREKGSQEIKAQLEALAGHVRKRKP